MKKSKSWLLALILAVSGIPVSADSTAAIEQLSKTPALHSGAIHFNAKTGTLEGTVYLNRGYETPRLPHLHVYAFGSDGKVLFAGCKELNDNSLHLKNRFNLLPRDTFSIHLPPNYITFSKWKIVTDSEDRCDGTHF